MKWWNSISQLSRTLIIIAVIVLVFLTIYWVRNYLKNKKQNQAFDQDFNQLTGQGGQTPSYPKSDYITLADKIYAAGCPGLFCYGTDEQAIYDVFGQMNNDLDVLLLVKAFGLREPRGGVCIPIPGTGDCAVALGEWLPTELSADEIQNINNIFSKKGIKYKF